MKTQSNVNALLAGTDSHPISNERKTEEERKRGEAAEHQKEHVHASGCHRVVQVAGATVREASYVIS